MRFLKRIFDKKDEPITSYADFWTWFQKHENSFFHVVKTMQNLEKGFFDKLSPKLAEVKEGLFYLTGMLDDNTAELVLTADGNVKNIVFVEELIAAAPKMDRWKFTALKTALHRDAVSIEMEGLTFSSDNLFFFANEWPNYPDEIDICIVPNDLTDANRELITNGVYIFLDNYLGELDLVNNVDNIQIVSKNATHKELVPIFKLKDFLTWRQKEFVEKYEDVRYDPEHDEYSILESKLESGNWLIAVVNTQLLNWTRKASHPWVAVVIIKYDATNAKGMPSNDDYVSIRRIENEMKTFLVPKDGYLNIGWETANGERKVYFACKDFRTPSKVLYQTQLKYSGQFEMEFDMYKDKYWQTFERFIPPS